jgi:hypothetical protein
MSALDELKAKDKKTPLEFAILAYDEMGGEATAEYAAWELAIRDAQFAAKDAEIARLKRRLAERDEESLEERML